MLVAVTSVTLDIPRFFQFKYDPEQQDYWPTELMEDPAYIRKLMREGAAEALNDADEIWKLS